jgi:hypothetical protein
MRKEGLVQSKQEFWYEMDLIDLENTGAFIPREIWDDFILKKSDKVKITPRDHTQRKRN